MERGDREDLRHPVRVDAPEACPERRVGGRQDHARIVDDEQEVRPEIPQLRVERRGIARQRLHQAETSWAVPISQKSALRQVDHVLGVKGIDRVGAPARAVQETDGGPDRQALFQITVPRLSHRR